MRLSPSANDPRCNGCIGCDGCGGCERCNRFNGCVGCDPRPVVRTRWSLRATAGNRCKHNEGKENALQSSLSYCRILPSVVTIAFQPALAARAALQRGRHAEASASYTALKSSASSTRTSSGFATLCRSLADADDLAQASALLGGRPTRGFTPALLSTLWRLHGRIAFAKGDQSRAIALLGRALGTRSRRTTLKQSASRIRIGPVLSAGRRHGDRARAHREGRRRHCMLRAIDATSRSCTPCLA